MKGHFQQHLIKALEDRPQLSINEQVLLFESTLRMDEKIIAQQQRVIEIIEASLSETLPGCRLIPFGSTVSGLASLHSDLDAYLCVHTSSQSKHKGFSFRRNYYFLIFLLLIDADSPADSQPSWAQQKERSLQLLSQACDKLRVHPDFVDVVFISETRIPLLKLVHPSTGVSCAISCHNEMALASSELVRSLL